MTPWPPPPHDAAVVRRIVREVADDDGAVLLALHAVQWEFGYVDPAALPIIAEVLAVPRAEVFGATACYPDLRMKPPTRGHLTVCVADGCQAKGSGALLSEAAAALGIEPGECTPDGIRLESVRCLGNCFLGPTISVDGRIIGAATREALEESITQLRDLMRSS